MPAVAHLLVLLQLASGPGPGGLPDGPSLLLQPFEYGVAEPEALVARATALQGELAAATTPLRSDLIVHRQVSPYLGVKPFDPEQNLALATRLSARLKALAPLLAGDRSAAIAAEKKLSELVTRRWACAEDCVVWDTNVTAARARVVRLERHVILRVDAASLERELLLLQHDYLSHVRDNLRVRVRRAGEPARTERIFERRAANETPRAMADAIEARKLAAAESARAKEQLLTDIDGACKVLQDRRSGKETFDGRITKEEERRAAKELEGDRVDQNHVAYQEKIRDLLSALKEGEKGIHEQFDALHGEFLVKVDRAIAGRLATRNELETTNTALEAARSSLRQAETAVPVSEGPFPADQDPCAEESRHTRGALEHAQLLAARTLVELEKARVAEHEAQSQTAQLDLDIKQKALDNTRGLMRQVLPHLSPAYMKDVFKYDANYFRRLIGNLGFLLGEGFDHLKKRGQQLRELPSTLLSFQGVTTTVAGMFWLLLILFLGRFANMRYHLWVVATWEWMKSQRTLQSVLEQLHSLVKLVSSVARQIIILITLSYACDYIGWHHFEVMAVYVVAEWVLLYRILRNLSYSLFVAPTWPADQTQELARALDLEPVLVRDQSTAQLSDRSLHMIAVYFIWRTAVLTTVELLLGQDYLYHLCVDVVSVVQWGLLGVLIVWWRERVAAAYLDSSPPFGQELVEKYYQRVWFAIFALPMAIVVLARGLGPWVSEVFSATGPFRFVTKFLSRRALEQAAKQKQAQQVSATHDHLPKRYERAFSAKALEDEAYVIAPLKPVQAIVDLYAHWDAAKRDGSVAIVGEAGMGKTTLINQVLRALPVTDEQVLRGRLSRKLKTEEEVIRFLTGLFGFETVPTSLSELEAAILADDTPICVIDDAHHLFIKTMGGMVGLDAFLHVVSVTCSNVFWITAFDSYPWFFIRNLKRTEPPFRHIVHLEPWSTSDLEGLVMTRSGESGYTATFEDLVVDRGSGEQASYEVVKTAKSYFRLLGDMTGGNPAVAIRYWLASLRAVPNRRTVRVGLYNPEPPTALTQGSDDLLFMLTSIAGHASLTPVQIAEVLRMPEDAVHRMLSYCEENHLIYRKSGVVAINLENYREIVRTLSNRGFIYF